MNRKNSKTWITKLFSCVFFGISAFSCAALAPVQLTPAQQEILVEETVPYRNEWLYQNCEVKDVREVLTPNRARKRADEVGANYVEVIYSDSPISLYSVMFACPQTPP